MPISRRQAFAAAAVLTVLLLALGATPLAVGLFASPWDKLAHFAVYFAIGCLVNAALGGRRPLLGFALTVALGAIDESLQFLEPGRQPELADLFADTVAACCAEVLGHRFFGKPETA